MQAVEVDTVIVGTGFGGLGLGIMLARSGDSSFVLLERADEVGGTWRDNVYPGVACDIPSHLYSFSFRQKPDWSHVFPSGQELHRYLQDAARDEGLAPHIRFNSPLTGASWDESSERWIVTTPGTQFKCKALVSAVGRLSEPKVPTFPAAEPFPGPAFHTSNWDDSVDWNGLHIGLVGSGASAVQVLPSLASQAEHVTIFQRTAPYVVPKNNRAYTSAEISSFTEDPSELARSRERVFWEAESAFPQRLAAPAAIDALREKARQHLEAQVANPKLREALTPDYEIGCKRILLSDDYYPALQRHNVTLEPTALVSLEGSVATAGSGRQHTLDALIFATGFQATTPPVAELISGRRGRLLSQHWADGMRAFASTVVHGFPNLFIIDGPNASLGHNSAVYMIETQIEYILGALRHLSKGAEPLDIPAEAEDSYTVEIDEAARRTVWLSGCNSWYVDERSGRLTLLWPGYAHTFRERNGTFDASPFSARKDFSYAGVLP